MTANPNIKLDEHDIPSADLSELDGFISELHGMALHKQKAKKAYKYPYPIEAIAPKDFYSHANHEHGIPYSLDYYKNLME